MKLLLLTLLLGSTAHAYATPQHQVGACYIDHSGMEDHLIRINSVEQGVYNITIYGIEWNTHTFKSIELGDMDFKAQVKCPKE